MIALARQGSAGEIRRSSQFDGGAQCGLVPVPIGSEGK